MERSSTGEGVREQSAERDCASQRDHSVAELSKLVHPIGTPINHATHIGFRLPPAHVAKPSPLVGLEPLRLWFPLTVTVVRRFIPPSLPLCPGPPVPSDLVGVGKTTEHPPPISLMRCANV